MAVVGARAANHQDSAVALEKSEYAGSVFPLRKLGSDLRPTAILGCSLDIVGCEEGVSS